MKKEEIERLKFRNQYLLTPRPVICPFLHTEYEISDTYRLYAHIDLKVSSLQSNGSRLLLLGDLFDYRNPKKLNSDILSDLSHYGFPEILRELGEYTGRFVLIHCQGDDIKLVHDTTAARKIYYCPREDGAWFSSRPQLLAMVLGFGKTDDPELLDYYHSGVFLKNSCTSVGDYTIYKEVRQLMPNHYYDVPGSTVHRYWPDGCIEEKKLEDAAFSCAKMVKGFMEAIIHRYDVMLPVTAGKDSRTLLAATKDFSDQVFYYVNKNDCSQSQSTDVTISTRLFRKHKLEFHVLEPGNIPMDKDFERVYFENNEFAPRKFLPHIYYYYVKFGEKVNLPGNTASSGNEWFKGTKMKYSGKRLAKSNHVDRWNFAIEYYDKWISSIREHCPWNNVQMYDLFYWEERMGNWAGQVTLDKDIAQEDINPFNSRNLVILYLSVSPKNLQIPFFKLYLKVIRILWPELLQTPINPCLKTSVYKLMKKIGVLNFYFNLRCNYF